MCASDSPPTRRQRERILQYIVQTVHFFADSRIYHALPRVRLLWRFLVVWIRFLRDSLCVAFLPYLCFVSMFGGCGCLQVRARGRRHSRIQTTAGLNARIHEPTSIISIGG